MPEETKKEIEGFKPIDDESGVQVWVPEDKYDEFVRRRNENKKKLHDTDDVLNQRLAAIETKLKEDAEAEAKAKYEAEIAKLKKDGNNEALLEMAEKRHSEQLAHLNAEKEQFRQQLVAQEVKGAFLRHEKFNKDHLEDALDLYTKRFEVTPEGLVKDRSGGGSYVKSDDGKRLSVGEHIAIFLDSKPIFLKTDKTPGTGLKEPASSADGKLIVSQADWDKVMDEGGPKSKLWSRKRWVDGSLIVTNA